MATAKLYVAGAVALVLACMAIAILYYRGEAIGAAAERDKARAELSTALAVNTANDAALKALTAGRAMDDKLLVELQGKLQSLAATTDSAFTAVRQLEKTNETVAGYMRTVLPDELRRLLATGAVDRKASGNGGAAP